MTATGNAGTTAASGATACGACDPVFPSCPAGAPCRPGAPAGCADPTDHVNVPTLDQLRAARARLDPGGPAMPLPLPHEAPDPFEVDPVVRAAKAIRAALEARGVQLDTGALLAAGEAAAVELDRVADHRHHWQAWHARQHPHVFVDSCDTAAGCPVHGGVAA